MDSRLTGSDKDNTNPETFFSFFRISLEKSPKNTCNFNLKTQLKNTGAEVAGFVGDISIDTRSGDINKNGIKLSGVLQVYYKWPNGSRIEFNYGDDVNDKTCHPQGGSPKEIAQKRKAKTCQELVLTLGSRLHSTLKMLI